MLLSGLKRYMVRSNPDTPNFFDFSSRAPSKREQKSRENELQNIARNAMELLQANGITAQTCTYPLAICNIHGEMCMGQKSTFTNTMCKYSFKDAFSNFCPFSDFCPFLQTPTPDLCVIVDFLYYLHIPPPPDMSNFADFASFLWLSIVKVYAIDLHCSYIYRSLAKRAQYQISAHPPLLLQFPAKV